VLSFCGVVWSVWLLRKGCGLWGCCVCVFFLFFFFFFDVLVFFFFFWLVGLFLGGWVVGVSVVSVFCFFFWGFVFWFFFFFFFLVGVGSRVVFFLLVFFPEVVWSLVWGVFFRCFFFFFLVVFFFFGLVGFGVFWRVLCRSGMDSTLGSLYPWHSFATGFFETTHSRPWLKRQIDCLFKPRTEHFLTPTSSLPSSDSFAPVPDCLHS